MSDDDVKKKKIMIIDDEEDIRIYLKMFLEDNDYDTCMASDGDEAFKMLENEKPDLITLDLQMPNETGTRFYRRVMKNEEFKKIPIIVVSGLAGRHLAVSEPVAVFEKPVDREELLKVVRETIG